MVERITCIQFIIEREKERGLYTYLTLFNDHIMINVSDSRLDTASL